MTRSKNYQVLDELSQLEKESARFIVNKEDDYLYRILGIPFSHEEITELIDHKVEVYQLFVEAESWNVINHCYPIIASFVKPDRYNELTKEDKNILINNIYNDLKEIYRKGGSANRFIGLEPLVDILPSIYINEEVSNQRLYYAIRMQRGERLSALRRQLVGYLIFLINKVFREHSLLNNEDVFMNFHQNKRLNNNIENSICDVVYNFFSNLGHNKYGYPSAIQDRLSIEGIKKFFEDLTKEIKDACIASKNGSNFLFIMDFIVNSEEYKTTISLFEKINKLQNENKELLNEVDMKRFLSNFIKENYVKINDFNAEKIKRKISYGYFKKVQIELLTKFKDTANLALIKQPHFKNLNSYKNFLMHLTWHLYENMLNVIESKRLPVENIYKIFIEYDIEYEKSNDCEKKERIRNKMNALDHRLDQFKQLKRLIKNYLELGGSFRKLEKFHHFDMFVDESLNLSSEDENINEKLSCYLQAMEDIFLKFKQVNSEDIRDCRKLISIYRETLNDFPLSSKKSHWQGTSNKKVNTFESQSTNSAKKISFSLNLFAPKKMEFTKDENQLKSARSYRDNHHADIKTSTILDENVSSSSNCSNHVMFKVTQVSLDEAIKNIKENNKIKAKTDYLDMKKEKVIINGVFFQEDKETIPDGYLSDTTSDKRKTILSPRAKVI